jgi:uncharacterized membrane protein
MTPIIANAYIPLAPIAPVTQIVLLILIIALEVKVIAKKNGMKINGPVVWRVSGVNAITAIIGIAVLIPASTLEAWLAFGWGSEYHINKALWWFSVICFGLILPFSTWIICYHLSWRTEFWVLKKWTSPTFPAPTKESVIAAHRWSYGILSIFVLAGCLYYWYAFIAYR